MQEQLPKSGILWRKYAVSDDDIKQQTLYITRMNDSPNTPADIIERIMQTARAALPESISQDVKNNVRAALQEVIQDLDVVSREELDIQKQVLAKTRAKVDEMEAVISELEKKLDLK